MYAVLGVLGRPGPSWAVLAPGRPGRGLARGSRAAPRGPDEATALLRSPEGRGMRAVLKRLEPWLADFPRAGRVSLVNERDWSVPRRQQ